MISKFCFLTNAVCSENRSSFCNSCCCRNTTVSLSSPNSDESASISFLSAAASLILLLLLRLTKNLISSNPPSIPTKLTTLVIRVSQLIGSQLNVYEFVAFYGDPIIPECKYGYYAWNYRNYFTGSYNFQSASVRHIQYRD